MLPLTIVFFWFAEIDGYIWVDLEEDLCYADERRRVHLKHLKGQVEEPIERAKWKGLLEGPIGKANWRGQLKGQSGRANWKSQLKGPSGRTNWKGRWKGQVEEPMERVKRMSQVEGPIEKGLLKGQNGGPIGSAKCRAVSPWAPRWHRSQQISCLNKRSSDHPCRRRRCWPSIWTNYDGLQRVKQLSIVRLIYLLLSMSSGEYVSLSDAICI